MMQRATVAALAALWIGLPAAAGELVLGLGADDLREGPDPGIGIEYRPAPFAAPRFLGVDWTVGLGFAAETDSDGDVWGGAGIVVTAPMGPDWRFEASVMPGYYSQGDDGTDLGADFPMFRSMAGVSYGFAPGWRAGLAISHKSNAGTADDNPGVETLFATLTRAF
jgi:hypothetical protein